MVSFSFSLCHVPSPSSHVHTHKHLFPSMACPALPPTSASHGGEKANPHDGQLNASGFYLFLHFKSRILFCWRDFCALLVFFTPELVCLLIQLCFTDVQHKGLCSFQAHLSLACRGWRAIKFSACGLSSLRASQTFINSAPQRLGAQLHPSCLGRLRPGGLSEVKE